MNHPLREAFDSDDQPFYRPDGVRAGKIKPRALEVSAAERGAAADYVPHHFSAPAFCSPSFLLSVFTPTLTISASFSQPFFNRLSASPYYLLFVFHPIILPLRVLEPHAPFQRDFPTREQQKLISVQFLIWVAPILSTLQKGAYLWRGQRVRARLTNSDSPIRKGIFYKGSVVVTSIQLLFGGVRCE